MGVKYVYLFDEVKHAEELCDGSWDKVRGLLGGKGANLGKMAAEGLPVPYGFTITTRACLDYQKQSELSEDVWTQVLQSLKSVEKRMERKFGDSEGPLLVSCRSGAKFSMPGMMDTLLNAGLTDHNLPALAQSTSWRFAYDSYRRLIQGFGAIVLGIDDDMFEDPLKEYKRERKYASDLDMTIEDWREMVTIFRKVLMREKGVDLPQEPLVQLRMAIAAVFSSWNSERAQAYRNITGISHDLGTACNIQAMVFGNMGDTSCTGVAFTRNPTTGERKMFGEFLENAQGEDVVAGIRSCSDVHDLGKRFGTAYQQLLDVGEHLEKVFNNMQDIEFTIQEGKLFMLQTRDGKRTALSQIRIAKEMVEEGLISREVALKRVQASDVDVLLMPQLDEKEMARARTDKRVIANGVNASPGGAVGQVVFDTKSAEALHAKGRDVVLVRPFTKPDDVPGFFASKGVLTAEGGATSHAAVVARQFGVPCICGASSLEIDLAKKLFTTKEGVIVREGDIISLNAVKGEVFNGSISTREAKFEQQKELQEILTWADEIAAENYERNNEIQRGLKVLANADSGEDAARARAFGAMGIGLCRTEHMFFGDTRLALMQEFILARNDKDREAALGRLLPIQTSDFEAIFRAMDGLPVVIRLLDPPLHEFLPDRDALMMVVTQLQFEGAPNGHAGYREKKELLDQVERLRESNPMMGLRGVRVSIMYPQLIKMQVQAIMHAAATVHKEGVVVDPEIMIPLTVHENEMKLMRKQCEEHAQRTLAEHGAEGVKYRIGTMVETPRAALTAGAIGKHSDFFSFGTNDLTQMTFGMSRDDGEREFLLDYVKNGILATNPFQTLDHDGVGQLVHMASMAGRKANPDITVGICGEHGGDPTSIALCHGYGLDYVSCSPFRIPAARLAAAHACISTE